jgi:phage gpG-like protein
MLCQTKRDIVNIAAVEGLHFFQDSFDNQGFTDVVLEPWKQKKQADGYKILLQTGFLKNSLQVFDKNEKRIVFGSDAEYAEIHNEGGTIQITNTARAKRFFWFMYKATGQMQWKYMALSKKPHFNIKMPKRQFIGESQTLLKKLEKILGIELKQRFKKL